MGWCVCILHMVDSKKVVWGGVMRILTRTEFVSRKYLLYRGYLYCEDLKLTQEEKENLKANLGICEKMMKNYYGVLQ